MFFSSARLSTVGSMPAASQMAWTRASVSSRPDACQDNRWRNRGTPERTDQDVPHEWQVNMVAWRSRPGEPHSRHFSRLSILGSPGSPVGWRKQEQEILAAARTGSIRKKWASEALGAWGEEPKRT